MVRKRRGVDAVPCVDREWQARDDLQTIQRAEDIRRDSGRMARVSRQLAKEQAALARVAGAVAAGRKVNPPGRRRR